MIKEYGKVIIEEDKILITGFKFDYDKNGSDFKKPQFDVIEWAKKRLEGNTEIE